MKTLSLSALALLAATALSAQEGCGIESGSVRILSNDFEALAAVNRAAQECATGAVTVTVNQTTEHQTIQGPALSVNPAEYTVAVIANDSIAALLNEGLLRPLDDLVARHGGQLQDSQLIRVDGQVMAIAFMANAQHLTYRADLLERAGLAPPTTYEEVLAAAEALRAQGIAETPFAANMKVGWDLAQEFVNMYLGHGGQLFEPGAPTLTIRNEQGVAALEMLRALQAYAPADVLTYDTNVTSALFASGGAALMNMWGSRAGAFLDPAQSAPEVIEGVAFAAAPTVAGGTIPATTVFWDGFGIARNVSDEDAEASFVAMMHGISLDTANANPDLAAWLAEGFTPGPASQGVIASAQAGAQPYPMVPWMGVLHGVLGTELADFFNGVEEADKALADVSAAYEAAAREQGFIQ